MMTHETMNKVLEQAIEQARKSWSEGGIPIGSALAEEDGTIVSVGHNMRVQTGDPTAHAEIVCLRNAGRRRDRSELYLATTLSPCQMCSGSACLFGVKHVIIGEHQTYLGAEHWLAEHGITVDVLNDSRCIELMRTLQSEKPDLWAEDIGE
jgi:creatinine deaminase